MYLDEFRVSAELCERELSSFLVNVVDAKEYSYHTALQALKLYLDVHYLYREKKETPAFGEILEIFAVRKISVSKILMALQQIDPKQTVYITQAYGLDGKPVRSINEIDRGHGHLLKQKDIVQTIIRGMGALRDRKHLMEEFKRVDPDVLPIPILEIPITALGLTTRTLNALRMLRIEDVGGIIKYDDGEQIQKFRNLGPTSLENLRICLAKVGYTLK